MTYLIDKSAWARLEVPSVAVVLEPLIQDDEIVVCPAFTLEVLYSARNAADHRHLRHSLAGFRHVPHTAEDWRLAELLQRELARIGKHRGPGVSDLLLAATAITHGLVVLHHDRDFLAIAEVSSTFRQQPVVPFGSL